MQIIFQLYLFLLTFLVVLFLLFVLLNLFIVIICWFCGYFLFFVWAFLLGVVLDGGKNWRMRKHLGKGIFLFQIIFLLLFLISIIFLSSILSNQSLIILTLFLCLISDNFAFGSIISSLYRIEMKSPRWLHEIKTLFDCGAWALV